MQTKLGAVCVLYPMPVVLVGAKVEGRVNFMTVAHVGILNNAPPQYLTVSLKKFRHTASGIKENRTFSLCLPSQAQVVATDYVGIVSGKDMDKSGVFEVFYGELESAPMITSCPVNMELRLHDMLDLPTHEVFVGELKAAYADPEVLEAGKVDLRKVRPLLFDYSSGWYWSLGAPVARCWHIGKER